MPDVDLDPGTGTAALPRRGRAVLRVLPAPRGRAGTHPVPRSLGDRLVEAGLVEPGDLARALARQARAESRLGDILIGEGRLSEEELMSVLIEQWRTPQADLAAEPPDPALVHALGPARCLRLAVVPWQCVGGVTLVATSRPERFAAARSDLEAVLGPVVMTLATDTQLEDAIARAGGATLARDAETCVPGRLSCRDWDVAPVARGAAALAVALVLAAAAAPAGTAYALACLMMVSLAATTGLKAAALAHALRTPRAREPAVQPDLAEVVTLAAAAAPTPLRLPVISMLVPLLNEENVAGHLVARLTRLEYPTESLDVIVLVEEGDATTLATLRRTRLPDFIRTIVVPRGTVQTKPRALNYGLPFAHGRIVGIWDAEDAPDPDQLHRVAAAFARRAPNVACLQGRLDFYNIRTNWMSRCFALEYATWFRGVLPGLQALGLPLPLGGTTVFFRREALERLACWDAHNVTEDADLGMRLARAGLRTEMLDTTTREEANCRPLPWIRQRSRWLKGYAMTWAVHMRDPRQLWRDLGPRGFIGFQTLFLGALTQFLLAPLMLSFWLLAFGLPHPLSGRVPDLVGWGFLALVIASEGVSIALTVVANRAAGRGWLLFSLPLLHLYFPLAVVAVYKAAWEMLRQPFFWDKTPHGLHAEEDAEAPGAARCPGGAAPSGAQ